MPGEHLTNYELLFKWLKIANYIVMRYLLIAVVIYVVFYFLLKRVLKYRKIQDKFPKLIDNLRDIFYSLLTVTIFSTVVTLTFWRAFPYTNMYMEIDKYGMVYYWITYPIMFLIHDTYFYWTHRFMHHPKIYKWVHRIHHKSTNPTPLTSYAFHPLEAFLEVMIVPIIAFTLPVHLFGLVTFLLLQFVYNVYGHLGYEILPKGFNNTIIGKWIGTSVAHNMHHKNFNGNYGLYFLFWDRIMGTIQNSYDKDYIKTFKNPSK